MPAEQPSRLASPEIDEGGILIGVAVGLVLTVLSLAGLLAVYDTVGRGAQRPLFTHPFPAPQLQTEPTASPRMSPMADPAGPHGRRHVDPDAVRFEGRIGAAMAAVAARGAAAYEPPAKAAP
ncbi:MAG TPA: hypothetical protein VHZ26_00975 [Caulobacteraceae bacterium]|jgi:hypothetical protein|nr:hypothetical protein [Caulobacteraceae bacterium]